MNVKKKLLFLPPLIITLLLYLFFFFPWITYTTRGFENINYQNGEIDLEVKTLTSKMQDNFSVIEHGSPYTFWIFVETDYACKIKINKLKIYKQDVLAYISNETKLGRFKDDSRTHFFVYSDIKIDHLDYELLMEYEIMKNGKSSSKEISTQLISSYSKNKISISELWQGV